MYTELKHWIQLEVGLLTDAGAESNGRSVLSPAPAAAAHQLAQETAVALPALQREELRQAQLRASTENMAQKRAGGSRFR